MAIDTGRQERSTQPVLRPPESAAERLVRLETDRAALLVTVPSDPAPQLASAQAAWKGFARLGATSRRVGAPTPTHRPARSPTASSAPAAGSTTPRAVHQSGWLAARRLRGDAKHWEGVEDQARKEWNVAAAPETSRLDAEVQNAEASVAKVEGRSRDRDRG